MVSVKSVRKTVSRSLQNALASFHSGEANYRLAIQEYSEFRVAFREGTADENVIRHSFDHDIFFAGVPEYQPRPKDVVIDVGAHIGTFSMLAASKVRQGVVHAIEASQETFNYLLINAAMNADLPIRAHHIALSDSDGEVTLHHDRGNWGHSIMKQLSKRGEHVRSMSLESFVRRERIENIAFMKFNCEGAEFPILMSAPDDLLRRVDKMLVLYHLDIAEGASIEALISRLERVGFTTTIRDRRTYRGWLIAERKDHG